MPQVRRAVAADLATLLPLVAEFCAVDGHPFDEAGVGPALLPLLEGDELGQVWVVAEPVAGSLGGYAVFTWGYSLESLGRDALLDELYVRDRNRGIGQLLMAAVLEAARAGGASRMFLETEEANAAVRRFYGRLGFEEERSIWMLRPL